MAKSELMGVIRDHLVTAGWEPVSVCDNDDLTGGLWIDPERPEGSKVLTVTHRAVMLQTAREVA